MQFVASAKCQHILKQVITTILGNPKAQIGKALWCGSIDRWGLSEGDWHSTSCVTRCSPVLRFLLRTAFKFLWACLFHAPLLVFLFPVYMYLFLKRCCCPEKKCCCPDCCPDEIWCFESKKEFHLMVIEKFEHPYFKFFNHNLFYLAFLCLIITTAFEEKFDTFPYYGLTRTGK